MVVIFVLSNLKWCKCTHIQMTHIHMTFTHTHPHVYSNVRQTFNGKHTYLPVHEHIHIQTCTSTVINFHTNTDIHKSKTAGDKTN